MKKQLFILLSLVMVAIAFKEETLSMHGSTSLEFPRGVQLKDLVNDPKTGELVYVGNKFLGSQDARLAASDISVLREDQTGTSSSISSLSLSLQDFLKARGFGYFNDINDYNDDGNTPLLLVIFDAKPFE